MVKPHQFRSGLKDSHWAVLPNTSFFIRQQAHSRQGIQFIELRRESFTKHLVPHFLKDRKRKHMIRREQHIPRIVDTETSRQTFWNWGTGASSNDGAVQRFQVLSA